MEELCITELSKYKKKQKKKTTLYSTDSRWCFMLGVTQILAFALAVMQILAYFDTNMLV